MNTTFTHAIRALICDRCGAPIQVALAGGFVQCQYCQTQHQLGARDDNPLGGAMQAPLTEQQRLDRLRMQDGQPLVPPPELQPLLQGGELAEWKVQEAIQIWQASRQELRQTGSPQAGERLLFLVILLGTYFHGKRDEHRERALYESSLDAARLPRHKQIIRGYLARAAVRAGDLSAAEQWLAPCDPRSDDLQMDSAWRYSRAFIETARGNYQGVLHCLGQSPGEVPILDAMDAVCDVFRANAWERLGRVDVATEQLRRLMLSNGGTGRRLLETIQARFPEWQLCPASHAAAHQQYAGQAARQASAGQGGGVGLILMAVGGLCLLIAVALCGVALLGLLFPLLAPGEGAAWFAGAGVAGGLLSGGLPVGITGVVLLVIGRGMRKSGQKAAHIRVNGIAGTGTILRIQPTGLSVNDVPQMRLTLRVQISGHPPYEASTKLLVSVGSMAQLTPGVQVPVRVDRDDPQSLIIETGGA